MTLALAGLTVVVTRPAEQGRKFSDCIAAAGGRTLLFPLLEIRPTEDTAALDAVIGRLAEFDLAIFISPNAVRYGMAAIRAKGPAPSRLKFAALGESSARALREFRVGNVIVPKERFDSEGLLALPELSDVSGQKIVVFRGNGGRELLGDTLRARGAAVAYTECYRRVKPDFDAKLMLSARPDVITVTSSEALAHLWDLLNTAEKTEAARIPLFVPHARIAEQARDLGWNNVIQTGAGDDGLLEGLIAWEKNRKAT